MKKFLLLLLPLLFACQLAGFVEPTPVPPATPNPSETTAPVSDPITVSNEPISGQTVPLTAASYSAFGIAAPVLVDIPAVVPLIEPSVDKLTDVARYNLSDTALQQLGQDGYLLRSDMTSTAAEVYGGSGPFMLTVDMVAVNAVAVQKQVLNSAAQAFSPRQTFDLLEGLIAQSEQQRATAGTDLDAQAAAKNLAIFTVAARLYDENWPIPPSVRDVVDTESVLFQSNGTVTSPLLNRPINYSTIIADPVPAIRAFIWLSLASPEIRNDQPASEQRIAARQIELLVKIWSDGSVPAWQQRYRRLQYQNGISFPMIDDWLALAELGLDGDDFVATAIQLPAARFEILPRSAALQQQLFDQLVFNRVGAHDSPNAAPPSAVTNEAGTIRAVPTIPDLAAALGSQLAIDQLLANGEAGYAGWDNQLAALRTRLARPEGWPATHQLDLLRAIQPLAQSAPVGYPSYMSSPSWNELTVWQNVATVTWVEAPMSGQRVSVPAGEMLLVVEPRPDVYANLAVQTRQLAQGLLDNQMLEQTNADKLLRLENELLQLKAIAEKGLAGQLPTAEENRLLAFWIASASGVNLGTVRPIFQGPFGELLHQTEGVAPALFVVLSGNQFVIVQGGRLQTSVIRN